MKGIKKKLTLLLIGSLILYVTGCKSKDENALLSNTEIVSIYQASPDAPALNILVNDTQINKQPFNYGDFTGYLRLITGDVNLKFTPSGATNIVIDTTLSFEKTKAYSIIVVNDYQHSKVLVLNDNSFVPAKGNANIRFLNLSPDTPTAALSNGTATLVADQVYKASSAFREIPASTYTFVVKANSSITLATAPAVIIQSGYYYTIVLKGLAAAPVDNVKALKVQVIVN